MGGSFTEDICGYLAGSFSEDIEDVELEPAARHVEAAEHNKKKKKKSHQNASRSRILLKSRFCSPAVQPSSIFTIVRFSLLVASLLLRKAFFGTQRKHDVDVDVDTNMQ